LCWRGSDWQTTQAAITTTTDNTAIIAVASSSSTSYHVWALFNATNFFFFLRKKFKQPLKCLKIQKHQALVKI